MPKRALVTGVTGQDGSLLAELLLARGYEVWGLVRGGARRLEQAGPALARVHALGGDLREPDSVADAVARARPHEVYHLGAETFVPACERDPELCFQVNALGTRAVFEAVRRWAPRARVCAAASSEVFGGAAEGPQSERTPLAPRGAYGRAKAYGLRLGAEERARGSFVGSAILYNHESERRGVRFLTRKVSRGAARIALGLESELELGDLSARRDWGAARDSVCALWCMLQHERPADYVVATGRLRSVAELCAAAFASVGLDWREHVRSEASAEDANRHGERAVLCGDAGRARRRLGWRPRIAFEQWLSVMVAADLECARAEVGASTRASLAS